MPKTRDAFALRRLYLKIVERKQEVGGLFYNDELYLELFGEEWLWMEPLSEYIEKIKTEPPPADGPLTQGKSSRVAALTKVFLISQQETAEKCDYVLARLNRHLNRLKSYSQKIFSAVLTEGLNENLKLQGKRITNLIACYQEITGNFEDYKETYVYDREKFKEQFQKACREELGERLRQARIERGLTIQDMAYELGMTRAGYGKYELGQRDLSTPTIVRLAGLLGCSLDWLFGLKERKN